MDFLDLRQHCCPEPLLQSKLWLKTAKAGQQLQLLVSDSGSYHDVPRFFQQRGHQVTVSTQTNAWLLTIRVAEPLK